MATRVVLTAALVAAVVVSASTQPAPPECTYADACYGEPLSAPAGGLLPDSCDALWAVTPDGGGGAAAPETPAPAPPVAAAVPTAPPASLVVPPPPAGAVAPPRAPQVCTYADACKVG
ncbi:hypothetical protein I4F81_002074 [Pyropia yezoensis]|uniref:Uncharacterized protein n=1 Tax=Pyropia yezoensis TaxID=2788 RepID=A0ACC3BNI1_PYRYE|nr:hypothetical protein I4F81_002074 [Neopyropia yezoensis]